MLPGRVTDAPHQKPPINHRASTYPATKLILIVTQAIAREKREVGKIGQPELGLGGELAIANNDSAVLRGCLDVGCHRKGSMP